MIKGKTIIVAGSGPDKYRYYFDSIEDFNKRKGQCGCYGKPREIELYEEFDVFNDDVFEYSEVQQLSSLVRNLERQLEYKILFGRWVVRRKDGSIAWDSNIN